LVSALLATGHKVIGMSNSENGARSLREKCAQGEVANASDENAVLALVRVNPNAVIDELTSLPKRYTSEEMRAAADRDRNVRLAGGPTCIKRRARPARSGTSCSPPDFLMAPAKASRRRRRALINGRSTSSDGGTRSGLETVGSVRAAR